jgi:hypothetical protein
MCDYSLQNVAFRAANVGDKLVTTNFGKGTHGFAGADDPNVAVCVRPGTEIAFDAPIRGRWVPEKLEGHTAAIFRQVNKEDYHRHHDALELPDGTQMLLTYLAEGQTATVLQLPAAPKTAKEAEEQERLEVVG